MGKKMSIKLIPFNELSVTSSLNKVYVLEIVQNIPQDVSALPLLKPLSRRQ